jgi:universal stress protein A
MSMYKHILFASDFSTESRLAQARAVEVARQNDAQLSIIHVVDYLPVSQLDGGLSVVPDLEQKLNESARDELISCAAEIPLQLNHEHLCTGLPKHEISDYAESIGADLIVLGSHGRHGLGLLLGSTANGVLHLARCDVLAVRVRDQI